MKDDICALPNDRSRRLFAFRSVVPVVEIRPNNLDVGIHGPGSLPIAFKDVDDVRIFLTANVSDDVSLRHHPGKRPEKE